MSYFEIPVTDMARAVSFYRAVFDIELERIEIDGNDMALFPEVFEGRGASGALACGDSYTPSSAGTRVYFAVDNIETILIRVESLGCAVLYPKTSIGELGSVAEFEDTEGNRVALSSPE